MTTTAANGRHALIVDDEAGIRYFFRAVLEKRGFVCSEAADGEEALAMMDQGSYDLMTLDVRMPGMGGLDVLREVRNQTRTLPIIIVTALGDPEIAATALTESGANGFVGKPCSTDQIVTAVERVMAVA